MYDVEQELRSALHDAAPEGRSVPFEPIARRARTLRTLRTGVAAGASALAVACIAVTASSFMPSAPVAGPSSSPGTPVTSQSASQAAGDCVRGLDPTRIAVDYIDFVRMYGHEYVGIPGSVQPGQVGRTVGTVRCTFSVTFPGPKHVPQDGDAAFLPVGTELHELKGYPPSARLVAKSPDRGWVIYKVAER